MTAPTSTLTTLVFDLVIPADADWPGCAFPILNPDSTLANLTGCSALGEIRPFAGSSELFYTWSSSPTTGQGLITLDVPSSTLTIRVLATESVLWTWSTGSYDLVLTNPAAPVGMRKTRVVMGHVTVSPQSTI